MLIFVYIYLFHVVQHCFHYNPTEFFSKKNPDFASKSGILGNFFNISLNFHMTNIVRIENK